MNIQTKQTEIYEKYGVFFAFSTDQYNKKAVEGVKYVNMGSGMVCPKDHAKTVNTELNAAFEACNKMRLETEGRENIIKDELANHEAGYTYDIDDTVDAVECYGITRDEVQAVFSVIY